MERGLYVVRKLSRHCLSIADRDGLSIKAAVNRLIEAEYVTDQTAQGMTASAVGAALQQARETMDAKHQRRLVQLRKDRKKLGAVA